MNKKASRQVVEALNYLSLLTELGQLLEICFEEYEKNHNQQIRDIRVKLLIDSYLSISKCYLEELDAALNQLKSLVRDHQ